VVYSVAFLSGGVSNYFLNRAWTFRSTGHAGKEGLSFMMVSVLALIVGLVVSALLSPWLGHSHRTWFLSTLAGIVVNFFVNKYWTFRSAD
jgi:putative flippase GtrA